jgi:hypothetical protein
MTTSVYYQNNKESIKEKNKQYREENLEKCREQSRNYYQNNKDYLLEYQREYIESHKDERKEYNKKYYEEHEEELSNYHKEYYQEHKEEIKAYKDNYKKNNQHVIDAYEENRKNDPKRKEQRKEHGLTLDGKYVSYKSAAKGRNILFNITKEEFGEFWQKPCEYCGSPIDTIGLDRIDNNIGYELTNLKSCCLVCNYIKKDNTLEYFTKQVIKIEKYNKNPKKIVHTNKPRHNSTYAVYKSGAKRRDIVFKLSREFVKSLLYTSCEYCGSTEKIGIDRVDNSIGYVESNVVACCKFCNLGKHKHTKEDFLSHITKIYNHLTLGDQ